MATASDSGVSRAVSEDTLERALREAGLKSLSREAHEKFRAYLELLLKWNSKLNLTAVREPEAIIRRHFVECIQCAQVIPEFSEGATLLDFGSGAGLPGIPITICRPEIRVTLSESQRKKAAFLREAVRVLSLSAEVFDRRVEEMTPEKRFAVVTLRAVDKMAEACRSAADRVAPGGWIVIFATSGTEPGLKTLLSQIHWSQSVPITGLERGRILLGQLG